MKYSGFKEDSSTISGKLLATEVKDVFTKSGVTLLFQMLATKIWESEIIDDWEDWI